MSKDWIKKHQKSEKSSWEAGEQEAQQMGRPKVSDSEKRKPRFTMNLNDAELELIQKAAEEMGQSQASFARSAALQKAKKLLADN
jgi:hypothetical protein